MAGAAARARAWSKAFAARPDPAQTAQAAPRPRAAGAEHGNAQGLWCAICTLRVGPADAKGSRVNCACGAAAHRSCLEGGEEGKDDFTFTCTHCQRSAWTGRRIVRRTDGNGSAASIPAPPIGRLLTPVRPPETGTGTQTGNSFSDAVQAQAAEARGAAKAAAELSKDVRIRNDAAAGQPVPATGGAASSVASPTSASSSSSSSSSLSFAGALSRLLERSNAAGEAATLDFDALAGKAAVLDTMMHGTGNNSRKRSRGDEDVGGAGLQLGSEEGDDVEETGAVAGAVAGVDATGAASGDPDAESTGEGGTKGTKKSRAGVDDEPWLSVGEVLGFGLG
jgi:hypothetical protein